MSKAAKRRGRVAGDATKRGDDEPAGTPEAAAQAPPGETRAAAWAKRAAFGVGALALAALACWGAVAGDATVAIDLEAQRSGWATLGPADGGAPAARLPILAGRQALRFEQVPLPFPKLLRLGLDTGGTAVRIRALEVSRNAGRGPRLRVDDVPSHLVQLNAVLHALIPLDIVPRDREATLILRDLEPPASLPLLGITADQVAIAGIVAFVLLGVLAGGAVSGFLLFLALLAAAGWTLVASWLNGHLGGPQPVSQAVGFANFWGLPKTSDFRLFVASFAFAFAGGLGLGRLVRRASPEPPPALARPRWPAALCAVVLPVAAFAILGIPDLAARAAELATARHDPSYDLGNFFTWKYALWRGWLPYRDFWYPYAGFSLLSGPFPWGWLLSYALEVLLVAVFAVAIWHNTRRSVEWTLAIVGGTVAALRLGMFVGQQRYLLALDLVLLLLAARSAGYSRRALLWVAAFATLPLVLEPNQLLYATPPIAIVIGADLWRGRRGGWDRRELLRRFAPAAAVFAGVAAVHVLILASRGQLAGHVEFLGQMDAMSVYSSLPVDVPQLLRPQLRSIALLGFAPVLLVMLGAGVLARSSGAEDDRLAATSLALGLLPLLPVAKYLVRPHIETQIAVYGAVGVAVVARELVLRAGRPQRWAIAAAASLCAGFAAPTLAPLAADVATVPTRAAQDAALIGRAASEHARLEEDYFFNLSRYERHRPLVERLVALGVRPDGTPGDRVYVLGDESHLYAALRQKPPYYVTLYNGSPLSAQRRTAAWLADTAPEWLVWNPSFQTFDDIPNLARVPILYAAAIEHYVPFDSAAGMDILRRGRATPDGAIHYWKSRLGSVVKLGAIPALSQLARAPVCRGAAPGCVEALRVHVDAPRTGVVRTIPVRVQGESLRIELSELSDVHDYAIQLERVWFLGPMRALGARIELEPPGPGCSAEVVPVAAAGELLW